MMHVYGNSFLLVVVIFLVFFTFLSLASSPTAQPTGPTSQPSGQPSGQPTRQPTSQPSGQPIGNPTSHPSQQPTMQPTCQPSSQPTGQPTTQPTGQPTMQPTYQPTSQPSSQPTRQPTMQPTGQPSMQPTSQPTIQPSCMPSSAPTNQPTSQPTRQPTSQPSSQPSRQPTMQPTRQPTGQPTSQPVSYPSSEPSSTPTLVPSNQPTLQPTSQPSRQPTSQPTRQPTRQPSSRPTGQPTSIPTNRPTTQPTQQPTSQPSVQPSGQPTRQPTRQPTMQPTCQPTSRPSGQPTKTPSSCPSGQPSAQPSRKPSTQPSTQPTRQPTSQPSRQPTRRPSSQPTGSPTCAPTGQPTSVPTRQPTVRPSRQPSGQPTRQPTRQPTGQPSRQPSVQPTSQPTISPTGYPTAVPSMQPTSQPSRQPSGQPTRQPTGQPTRQPTTQPTGQPTRQPSGNPSSQPSRQPTSQPSSQPTGQPTISPSCQPTVQPSNQPTRQPTSQPSSQPFSTPTSAPTMQPTSQPTRQPTSQPSRQPTSQPTVQPTSQPTRRPSCQPSRQPTSHPSAQPTSQPTRQPSSQPTSSPSMQPSSQPTRKPSCQPSNQPTSSPTVQPTGQPSRAPSCQPTTQPTRRPSGQPTCQPTRQPTSQPSRQPSAQPTSQPSAQPVLWPTSRPTSQPSRQPTAQPTSRPSSQPSTQPSSQPTMQPSTQPSGQPTMQPSRQPTSQPTSSPSMQPTSQPSRQPTAQPTCQPTNHPTTQPTLQPTRQPTSQPTNQPTRQPTSHPSMQPTRSPSGQPSVQPTSQPTSQPTLQPTSQPSRQPSRQPTCQPTNQPTSIPTRQPTSQPSGQPTIQPTSQPTAQPTMQPSGVPSQQPTIQPSGQPSCQPTNSPTRQPTQQPTNQPTRQPSRQPTGQPSRQPSGQPSGTPTMQPSRQPTGHPTCQPTIQPTMQPSNQPTSVPSTQPSIVPSSIPTMQPSSQPTRQPSSQPSRQPTTQPSNIPTRQPSMQPSSQPSAQPSRQPTIQPTNQPTCQPTSQPTRQPTGQPSRQPTSRPTSQPSGQPTQAPSNIPSMQPSRQPTGQPSGQPSSQPTRQPTMQPTRQPTRQPTCQPTVQPTMIPSAQPTSLPTCIPTMQPSMQPTSQPTRQPTSQPSRQPTMQPTCQPSMQPSLQPTTQPTRVPTVQPSTLPSSQPSRQPTIQPTSQPTGQPTCQPTRQPSVQPSSQPSVQPTRQPTTQPTIQPSCQPTGQPSMQPSLQPTVQPTSIPSGQPSNQPTGQPSYQPSNQPSCQPSMQPSAQPTCQPTTQPTCQPTTQPSHQPTMQPTYQPTGIPTRQPTNQPTTQPSCQPSSQPSVQPTSVPSGQPSPIPTMQPSCQPTAQPSGQPTCVPTCQPTKQPSMQPTTQPTIQPTLQPSRQPSSQPSRQPTSQPTRQPSSQPSRQPTCRPSIKPTGQPSIIPSGIPTHQPTSIPSARPTSSPVTSFPMKRTDTHFPTSRPTTIPTLNLNDYTNNSFYLKYLQEIDRVETEGLGLRSLQYETIDYKGVMLDGSCDEWDSFALDHLDLPFPGVHFQAITVSFGKTLFQPNTAEFVTSVCSDISAVAKIVAAFRSGDESVVKCGSDRWLINSCNGKICINCRAGPCYRCDAVPLVTSLKVCSTCPYSMSRFGVVRLDIGSDIYYPQFLSINITNTSSTKIDAIVNLTASSAGYVACAAVEQLERINTVDDIAAQQTLQTSLITNPSSSFMAYKFVFSSLAPETRYNIYCYSSDLNAHVMPMSVVNAYIVASSTKCCKSILIAKSPRELFDRNSTVAPSLAAALTFAFHFNARPAANPSIVTVSPQLWRVNCSNNKQILSNQSALPTVSPSAFIISALSKIADYSFSIQGGSGCYSLLLVDSSSVVQYLPSSKVYFRILPSAAPLSAPQLSAAELSNDGLSILVTFDSPTDLGVKSTALSSFKQKNTTIAISVGLRFPCSIILSFSPAAGHYSSLYCQWKSQTSLVVDLSTISSSLRSINIGDFISIRPYSIKSNCIANQNCSRYSYSASSTSVIVSAPMSPTIPTIILSGPAFVTVCDKLVLDLSNSKGAAGRNWTNVRWSANTTSTTLVSDSRLQTAALGMANYLNSNFNFNLQTSISIPSTKLVNGTFVFTVKASNYFGISAAASISVAIKDSRYAFPIVSIVGNTIKSQLRSQSFDIISQYSYPSCQSPVRGETLSITWKVFKGFQYDRSVVSTSKNNRIFRVPAYSLQSMTQYNFLLTISSTDPSNSNVVTQTVTVNVGLSGVKASIVGPSVRSVSYSSSAIIVDASSSYDLDNPILVSGSVSSSLLNFTWQCMQIAPLYGKACSTVSEESAAAKLTAVRSSVIRFNNTAVYDKYFDKDAQYLVTVFVSNSYAASDSASVTLSVLGYDVPVITIDTSSAIGRFNPGAKTVLTGRIQFAASAATVTTSFAQAVWSCDSVDLSTVSLTSTSKTLALTDNISPVFQLVLSPNVLSPGGVYTFTLTTLHAAVEGMVSKSSAAVTLVMNSPPQGGTLISSPSSGLELNTTFLLNAANWIDTNSEDYPLSYTFAKYNFKFSIDGQILIANSPLPTMSSSFSRGLTVFAYVIHITVSISDNFGCATLHTSSITVRPLPKLDYASISRYFDQQVSVSGTLLDSDSVISTVTTTSNIISPVNCSISAFECEYMNRHYCYRTPGTCGPCLDGFLGFEGDSNLPCRPAKDLLKNGERCYDSSACFSGLCQSFICVDKAMSCNNNCSGHGDCLMIDIATNQQRANNWCAATDITCSAMCICRVGYFGDDCSLTQQQYANSFSLRDKLCSNLLNTISQLDASVHSITSLAAAVANVLQYPSQLSSTALIDCATSLTTVVTQFPSVFEEQSSTVSSSDSSSNSDDMNLGIVVHQALANALKALNTLVFRREYESSGSIDVGQVSSLTVNISKAIAQSMFGMQNSLGIDDGGKTIVSNGIRASTKLVSIAEMRNMSIATPQAPSELWLHLQASSVEINTTGISSNANDGAIGLTLVQYPGRKLAGEYNSSTLQIHISTATNSASTSTQQQYVTTTFVLQNKEAISYKYYPRSYQLYCTKFSKHEYTEIFACPDPEQPPVQLVCPARSSQFTNYSCPAFIQRPSCMSRNPLLQVELASATSEVELPFAEDTSCELVSFTAWNTTCRCTYPLNSVSSQSQFSRRLQTTTTSSSYAPQLSYEFTSASNAHREIADASGLYVYVRVNPIWLPTLLGTLSCMCILIIYGCAHVDSQGEMPLAILKDVDVVQGQLKDSYLPNIYQQASLWVRISKEFKYHHEWIAAIRSLYDHDEGCDGYTSDNSGIPTRAVRASLLLLRILAFVLFLVIYFTRINNDRKYAEDAIVVCVVSALCYLLARVVIDVVERFIRNLSLSYSEVGVMPVAMDIETGKQQLQSAATTNFNNRTQSFSQIGPSSSSAGSSGGSVLFRENRPTLFESPEIRHRVLKSKRSEAKSLQRAQHLLFNRNFNLAWAFNEFDNWDSRDEFSVLNAYCGTQIYAMEIAQELGVSKIDSVERGRISWALLNLFILDMLPSYCTTVFRRHFHEKSQLEYLLRHGQEAGGGSFRSVIDFEYCYYLQLRCLSALNMAMIATVVVLVTKTTSNQQLSIITFTAYGILADIFLVSSLIILVANVLLPMCIRPYVRRLQSILERAVANHEADIVTYNEGNVLQAKEQVEHDGEEDGKEHDEKKEPLVTRALWGRAIIGQLVHDTRQSLSDVPNFVKQANAYIQEGHAVGAANPKLAGKHIKFQLTSMFYTYFNVAQRYRGVIYISDVLSGFGTVWPKQHLANHMMQIWGYPPERPSGARTRAISASSVRPSTPSNHPVEVGGYGDDPEDGGLSLMRPMPTINEDQDGSFIMPRSPGGRHNPVGDDGNTVVPSTPAEPPGPPPTPQKLLLTMRVAVLVLRIWSMLPGVVAHAVQSIICWATALLASVIHVYLYRAAPWAIVFPPVILLICGTLLFYYPPVDFVDVSLETPTECVRESMIIAPKPTTPGQIDLLDRDTFPRKDAKSSQTREEKKVNADQSGAPGANKSGKVAPAPGSPSEIRGAQVVQPLAGNASHHHQLQGTEKVFPLNLSLSSNNGFGFGTDHRQVPPPINSKKGTIFPSPTSTKKKALSPLGSSSRQEEDKESEFSRSKRNPMQQVHQPPGSVKDMSVDKLKRSVVPSAQSNPSSDKAWRSAKTTRAMASNQIDDSDSETKGSPGSPALTKESRKKVAPQKLENKEEAMVGSRVPMVPSIVKAVTTDADLLGADDASSLGDGGESEESLNSEDESMLHRVSGFFHDIEKAEHMKSTKGWEDDSKGDYYGSYKLSSLAENEAVALSSESDD